MNVYDFDQTVFQPDSSYAFVLYCLRRYPRAVLPSLPAAAGMACLHLLKKADTRRLKEAVFSFLPRLDDVDRVVDEFWAAKSEGLEPWYLAQKREDDLIISASPYFLLHPMTERLGVRLIATPMDRHTGRIIGRNCHDVEKVVQFTRAYPGEKPDEFYSDSLSDTPMADIARRAFLVNKGTLSPWPDK